MRAIRRTAYLVMLGAACIAGPHARAQVVINELVQDERTAGAGAIPDTREFIELYNPTGSPVNIGGWTMSYWQLGTTAGGGSYFATTDTIPSGTILAPNDYWVMGDSSVPNVDQILGTSIDLFPDLNTIFELRDGARDAVGVTLKDAVGIQTFRNVELANANQDQLNQIAVGQTAGPNATGGVWGQIYSTNVDPPNTRQSIARYIDGADTNKNGRDFGMLPLTPGTSNNLPQNASHTIPNVDAMSAGTALGTNYYSSFVLPRVIDPTQVGPLGSDGVNNINTKAIPRSPQLGNAIIAYDETGGGNASYSKELVNKFGLYAYIETADLNLGVVTANNYESSTYGIGTTDSLFAAPNQAGLTTVTSSANGNTGVGWVIQRVEALDGGLTTTLLQLVDFNDGGDSVPGDNDWQVKQSIDLTGLASGWHILSIDIDPTTGAVTAKYDANTYTFTTATGWKGTFYTGYRENLPGTGNTVARPPTYDLYVAPVGLAGDYNGNGKVDAADYVLWRNGGPLQNGGSTGPDGYTVWRANFGATAGSGSGLGESAAVPEPGSLLLVLCGAAIAAAWRRRG